jgi:hypothetical protein
LTAREIAKRNENTTMSRRIVDDPWEELTCISTSAYEDSTELYQR